MSDQREEPATEAGREAVKLRGLFGGETAERATNWVLQIERESAARAAPRAEGLPFTTEQLANAMAVEGYADPDMTEQWAAPVEAARRILARLGAAPRSERPDVRQIEQATANLVIAFRRWCKRKDIELPTIDEYRAILDEAAWLASRPSSGRAGPKP